MKEIKPQLPNELRRTSIFVVNPTDADSCERMASSLMRNSQAGQVQRLLSLLKSYVGELKNERQLYYRITNTNYIKIYLDGLSNQTAQRPPFCLIIGLTGFSDIPFVEQENAFLPISVVDCVDAHWLMALIRSELSKPQGEQDGVVA